MDIGAALIKLKPDSFKNVENWKNELQQRKNEAIETLKAEGVYVESWFHIKIDEQDYLIAYMRANNIDEAQKIAKSSKFDIDQVHKEFKKNWLNVSPASLLIDLENF